MVPRPPVKLEPLGRGRGCRAKPARAWRVSGAGGNAAREAFRLTRVAEYELLLLMRRVRMRLPALLLLLVASLAAVQPLARPQAGGLAAVDGALLGDLRIA